MKDTLTQYQYKDFFGSLLMGDRISCSQKIQLLQTYGLSIPDIYENVLKTSLYKIGELWEYNKISVATEHLASAIVESILNELHFNLISDKKNNKAAILACVENESHQIGIKMIGDVFEMNEWNTFFLGANTPTDELFQFAKTKKPNIFAFSLSLYFNLPALEKTIQKTQIEFPTIPILVGGQAFTHGGQEVLLKYQNVVYQPNLESTQQYIKNVL